MSLMVNPIVAEYLNTIEHDLRVAKAERRCRDLGALATPTSQPSRRPRLQARIGDLLIAAGERLRGDTRLAPAAG
jgi:hypothetical protein